MRTRWTLVLLLGLLAAGSTQAAAAGRCGAHPWCDTTLLPQVRAELLLGAMAPSEQLGLLAGDDRTGVDGGEHVHTGTQLGIPRLDVPTVLYADGPAGPRQGRSSGLSAPIALAATFNPGLAAEHGRVAAAEARAKGNDVIYGPTVNLARTPLGGRVFEAYGEDPHLASALVDPWVRAAQAQGVLADVKHLAANNQEGLTPEATAQVPVGEGGSRDFVDARIDERTLREVYLPHFEAAVRAGVATVMCAYNRVNGPYSCQNEHLLTDVLRRDWGFEGYVLADYGAVHGTAASLQAGLSFEPFGPLAFAPERVAEVVTQGLVAPAVVQDRVRAMLRTWFAHGLFDRAAYRDDDAQIDKVGGRQVARAVAEQAVTLLRNQDDVLPLARGGRIAVIGRPATEYTTGTGSSAVQPFSFAAPLDAIRRRAGPRAEVVHVPGDDVRAAAQAARRADVALVLVADRYGETADRACLSLQCPPIHGDQDGLVEAVAAANPRTVVVLVSGGPDLMPWRSRVAGILEAWYGGGQAGPALAAVLFGDADPGGRLPITFPASERQGATATDKRRYPGVGFRAQYSEGVLVGHRWYDRHRQRPAFPFGFGLSYTSMRFSDLRVRGRTAGLRVTNTGERKGYAVPQLYLGLPAPRPGLAQARWQLKGFDKLLLAPGASRRVSFTLDDRALSSWDVRSGGWRIAPGCVRVAVGRSSRDLPLRGRLCP